jgi:hypothetical protein
MKKLTAFVLAVSLAAAASPASALGWNELGAQQFGMGGAGVADAQGPLAAYWNPAALGRPGMNAYGLALPVDAEVNIKGPVIQGAKDLSTCASNGAGCTQGQLDQARSELSHPGEGLLANAGGGGNLKIGKFTVFLNEFVDLGAQPNVDPNNAHWIIGPGLASNTSSLIIRGVRLGELGVAYGHELPWTPGLYLGGDVKVMRAEVGFANYGVVSNSNFNAQSISKNLQSNTADSGNFGVDAGALWDLDKSFDGVVWAPRLGVTGHNLNNPKFDEPGEASQLGYGRFAVNPSARAGLSFSPEHWWHFAADADLTKNLTSIDDAQSQYVGAGTEIDVFNRSWINIPVRVGIKHNMANTADGATFTAGTGVNLLHFIVDVSGEYANQDVTTQSVNGSTKIPKQFGAAIQLSFLFGGADERREHASATADDQVVPSEKARGDMNPSAADRVRADSDRAHQELNSQPAPSGQ